jgi:putative Mg2+ transporter-C (MgtC) family protein
MEAIHNINLRSLADTCVSLATAFVLGAAIGFERQVRQRAAGLRTNVLVAVGAATFVDLGNRLMTREGAAHVVAYVISGVGFLGAGAIMRSEGSVRGLNTAATLWGSAAVGACAGADLLLEAAVGAAFVLAANTLLRPVVNAVNRQPINPALTEATYAVYLIAQKGRQQEARQLLEQTLAESHCPIRELGVHVFGRNDVELTATLTQTAVETETLDHVVAELVAHEFVSQAFWSPTTPD